MDAVLRITKQTELYLFLGGFSLPACKLLNSKLASMVHSVPVELVREGRVIPNNKSTLSVCDIQVISTNYRIASITPIIRLERDSLRTALSEAARLAQAQLASMRAKPIRH